MKIAPVESCSTRLVAASFTLLFFLIIMMFAERNPIAAIVDPLETFDIAAPMPSCGRWKDQMPKVRQVEPYTRYIAARKKWRSKRAWELTSDEIKWIFAEVSWAASQGDWGARALLSHFYLNSIGMRNVNWIFDPDPFKAVELMAAAAQAGQAWGYYDLGTAVENGYGSLKPDREAAWRLYLKAARLGSPEAQIALSTAYLHARKYDEATAMLKCAFDQGSGEAASTLSMGSFIAGDVLRGMEYLQQGVKFGDGQSAHVLARMFADGEMIFRPEVNEMYRLEAHGYKKDAERGKRYEAIVAALDLNKDLRFPLLDTAIPPPPAKLPDWTGIEDAIGPEPEGPPSY